MIIFEIAAIGGLFLGAVSLFYTWYRNRVKGPQFLFRYVRVENPWIESEPEPKCSITAVMQNIGDRMGYLIIEDMQVIIHHKNKLFYSEILKEDIPASVNWSSRKSFTFTIDEGARGWLKEKFRINGVLLDHKGKELKYEKDFPLENKESLVT